MQYTIEEHEIRNRPYKDPISFIKDYTFMYNKQSRVPYKVYFKDIQYSKVYEKSLLNYLIENINTTEENDRAYKSNTTDKTNKTDKTNLESFIEIEDLLKALKNERFYDKSFYEITLSIYLKGVAILLDKVILEIEKLNFENVKCLYFYCSGNINLYKVMSTRLAKYINEEEPVETKKKKPVKIDEISVHNLFWTNLQSCINNLEFLNKEIQISQSEFADNQELLKRISISDILLGEERINLYNKKVLMDLLLIEITNKFDKTSNEERYLFMTNLTSELIVKGICDETELVEYFKYSKDLLSCL